MYQSLNLGCGVAMLEKSPYSHCMARAVSFSCSFHEHSIFPLLRGLDAANSIIMSV